MDFTSNTKESCGKAARFLAKPRRQNITATFDSDVRGAPDKGLEEILFSQPRAKCHAASVLGKPEKNFTTLCWSNVPHNWKSRLSNQQRQLASGLYRDYAQRALRHTHARVLERKQWYTDQ